MRIFPQQITRDEALRYWDEQGNAKPQEAWDDSDEALINAEATAYQKRIRREEFRRQAISEEGLAIAEAGRFEAHALESWLSEGGH